MSTLTPPADIPAEATPIPELIASYCADPAGFWTLNGATLLDLRGFAEALEQHTDATCALRFSSLLP